MLGAQIRVFSFAASEGSADRRLCGLRLLRGAVDGSASAGLIRKVSGSSVLILGLLREEPRSTANLKSRFALPLLLKTREQFALSHPARLLYD